MWSSSPSRSTRTVGGWWCATVITSEREVLTAAGAVEREGAAGQRPTCRPRYWCAAAVFFGDPAGLGAQVAADGEVLPLLYLHGLSTSDFGPALEQFLGSGAGLSAATITRLTAQWQDEARAFGHGICPAPTTSTCGSTGSTSRFASNRRNCACW